jgi:hypothetical protein
LIAAANEMMEAEKMRNQNSIEEMTTSKIEKKKIIIIIILEIYDKCKQ